MNIVKYPLGAFTTIAMVLGMSLVSCSDKPTEPTVTKPSYKIAFFSNRDGDPRIFSMNNDGKDQKCLISDSTAYFRPLSWSPDGSQIAFNCSRYPHENAHEVYVMRADGTFATRLTYSIDWMGEFEADPAWSPDGGEIVFTADWTSNAEIYVMNADGTNLRRLTTSPGSGLPVCAISEY